MAWTLDTAEEATKLQDDKLISVLRAIRGKGPLHWRYVAEHYITAGGKLKGFANALMVMQDRYPNRLIITRPYNLSESPMIEVPE